MIIPVGPVEAVQQLRLIAKSESGAIEETVLDAVRFVPLTRERP